MTDVNGATDAARGGQAIAASFRRNTAAMAASTVLSRLTGFGRVFALAYAVGFERVADTYNVANTTPNIVYELILGGILSATLVPVFVDRLTTSRDEDDAWEAVSAIVTVAVAAVVALAAALFVLAPVIIKLYTFRVGGQAGADQQAAASALLRWFAPQVAFYGFIALATALLNAQRRFVAPAITPVLNNVCVIVVLLVFPHVYGDISLHGLRHSPGAIALLGLGTTAGVGIQAFALLPSLRRAGLRLRAVWAPRHDAVRQMLRLSGWTFGYVIANQIALWVVIVLANGRSGDVAAYQAAFLFFLLPHAIFAVSIMTALLPDLSERWATGDRTAFRDQLSFGLRTTALILLPAAAGYVVLARPVIRLVLEHGALSSASAATTGDVLRLMALGLPAFSAYLLLMRAYTAMQNTRVMFFTYVAENALNVGLAFALYPSLGVQGLGLALAIAYVGGTAVALWDVRRRAGGLDGRRLLTSVGRIVAATGVMAAGVAVVSAAIGGDHGLHLLLRVGVSVVAGVTLFALAARLAGVLELASVLRIRRRPSHSAT
jgi:putative peptidoglycan lipid II flippase